MSSRQLSNLLDEQTTLRTQMEDLFAQRAAITLQMKEIEERLHWIDGEIDRVESEEVEIEVKHEPAVNQLTQHPDEFLTDPTSDDVEDMIDDMKEAAGFGNADSRRVSESPAFNTFDNQQFNQDQGDQKPAAQRNYSTNVNPFGDLWSAKDRNQFEYDGNCASNFKPAAPASAAAKSNTLERYFVRSEPAAAPAATSTQNNQSILPNSMSRTNNTLSNINYPPNNNQQHPWTQRLHHHLHHTFRIPSFRDHQLSIINGTLSNRDVFVIMRTGGGKSLTYQLPAILEMESSNKVTVVISPLLSLIRDQEEQMNQIYPGSATSFTSGMGREEHAQRWDRVRDANGGVALVFVTPEKVASSGKFKGEMERLFGAGRLGRFVIGKCYKDITNFECMLVYQVANSLAFINHRRSTLCYTMGEFKKPECYRNELKRFIQHLTFILCVIYFYQGHDFRPDYTKLGILKHHFPSIPVLAVTATASDRVRQDCCDILKLNKNHLFFRSTANRPNLTYIVKSKADSKDAVINDMVAFIKDNHENEAGIIYTFSKKEADEVSDSLCSNGIVARAYHSDVSESRKNAVHRSWMRNETQVRPSSC
jgi:hypothetical protein